jgi:DNA primase small subunit
MDAVDDIIIQYTYPRIDTEVSKKLNHLLKSPFCIHPGTGSSSPLPSSSSSSVCLADLSSTKGRVCVPLLASEVESFDPDAVPTVGQLLMELEGVSSSGDDKAGWEKTSLRPYVELFERHIEGLVKLQNKVKQGESARVVCVAKTSWR